MAEKWPKITTIERSPKGVDDLEKYREIMNYIPEVNTKSVLIGGLINEKLYGQFANDFLKHMTQYPNLQWTDTGRFFERVMAIKSDLEQVFISLIAIGYYKEVL
eukprot:TRINITY_DN19282_c0_g1_i1.p2 TRINITY_DN19282_c0_g1~~TRINITY_DN19282_c0_g1_i1.p2  ORF type:complete len:104 (+),score=14.25 TRINITY_DN19282_c0_g1_i1:488-799(+)